MRRTLMAIIAFGIASVPGLASADGPSGSTEKNNVVTCAEGTDTPVGRVYAGPNGVELCSDDNSAPDGRIIVSFEGQYITADGDSDNGQASGFVRLDSSGPTCSTPQQQDATAGAGGACGG